MACRDVQVIFYNTALRQIVRAMNFDYSGATLCAVQVFRGLLAIFSNEFEHRIKNKLFQIKADPMVQVAQPGKFIRARKLAARVSVHA